MVCVLYANVRWQNPEKKISIFTLFTITKIFKILFLLKSHQGTSIHIKKIIPEKKMRNNTKIYHKKRKEKAKSYYNLWILQHKL